MLYRIQVNWYKETQWNTIDTYVVGNSVLEALRKFLDKHPEDFTLNGNYTIEQVDKEILV